MIRRVVLLVLTAVVLVSLSGCMGGGPNIDKDAIMAAIGAVIDGFEEDIETYDVDGLLACLSETDFELTLREAGAAYDKDLATLQQELEADEEYQLDWRETYGYQLDLQLDPRVFSNVSATGAIVTQEFVVAEVATGIPMTITDQGDIVWHFVKIGGEWKVSRLLIKFEPVGTKAAGVRTGGGVSAGFGFGVGFPGLGD